MDRNTIYVGSSAPLPERIPLRAGPLSLVYEQGDLRSICLGEREILRRVYVAIRDRNWGTVAPVYRNVQIQAGAERFSITYDAENQAEGIDFVWHAAIRGEEDGSLSFQMEGAARSTFYKNRIGFCVLHPAGLSGQKVEVEHVDGAREQTSFPADLCADQPVQPFANLRAIRHQVMPGVWANLSLDGELFEMEDQRLWTDASFKAYCTPLGLPYPVEIRAGTRVAQSVTLALDRQPLPAGRKANRRVVAGWAGAKPESARNAVRVHAAGGWRRLPPLGLATASHDQVLSAQELNRLRTLHLHHLRVEVKLSQPADLNRFLQAAGQARALEIPLEVALAVDSDAPEQQLAEFRRRIDELRPTVCGWLVFPEREPYAGGNPSEGIARLARAFLKPFAPDIPLAVGTNTDFIFLKRTALPLPWMDQVCIALNPQVHAFDNASILETLEAQPVVVESARRLSRGLPVVVSPITLKPRFNPYASGPQPQLAAGEMPPQADPRQRSLFGAGWTLGSLCAMVMAGAERVTYYETSGWQGVMETDHGAVRQNALGIVFPLYHVLADAGEFAGGQACPLHSSSPLRLSGMALRQGTRLRYVLANHTAEPLVATLETTGELFEARPLDETNAEAGMREPEIFRRKSGLFVRALDGEITFRLEPYGILTLDDLPEG